MGKPREWTVEEARDQLLEHFAELVYFWEWKQEAPTAREKLEGLLLSILTIFDGGSTEFPPFNIVTAPYESHQEHYQARDENWFPSGVVINRAQLHMLINHYHKIYRKEW